MVGGSEGGEGEGFQYNGRPLQLIFQETHSGAEDFSGKATPEKTRFQSNQRTPVTATFSRNPLRKERGDRVPQESVFREKRRCG